MYVAFYEDNDKDRLTIVKAEPDEVGDNELVIDPSWTVTQIQALASAHYDRIYAQTNSITYQRLCKEAYGEEREGDYSYWPAAGNPSWIEEHESWFGRHGEG